MGAPLFNTARATVFVEVGIGDSRIPSGQGRWDVDRWDTAGAEWAGVEPTWLDVTCDARHWDTLTGRASVLERFLPGSLRLVLDDPAGTYSVMPPDGDAALLILRPGRQIRWGIDHATMGRVVMWRGIVDEVNPVYPPIGEGTDGVEVVAVDMLGDVGRAKITGTVELPAQTTSARVHAILDAALVTAERRDVTPSSVGLVPAELSGQAADLLGRTADSEGGAIYGDTDGRVTFRPRDWQTYVPGTPVDATIGNVEPADICPSGWVTTFRRADLTTRAIMGRDDGTVAVVDDHDGQVAYGIEPFERTDLWCDTVDQLARLANRWIAVRSGNAVPRIQSVAFDAARGDVVVDLLAATSPFTPSRWRCRHDDDGRLVFDRDMFVTAVAHTVTAGNHGARWTAVVSLDPAAPFAAPGGRWDTAGWDRAIWTDAVALLDELDQLASRIEVTS